MMENNMTEFDFFERGYYVTTMPKDIEKDLWHLVYTTEWVTLQNSSYLQCYCEYGKVPSWHPEIVNNNPKPYPNKDYYHGSKSPEYMHPLLVDIGNRISHISELSTLTKYKDIKLKYLANWNGSGDLEWHNDFDDGTELIVLCYLTDELEWKDYGGEIELCKYINGDRKYYKKEEPTNGKMIIINNTNPLMLHKVSRMKNRDINRFLFNFTYSWT